MIRPCMESRAHLGLLYTPIGAYCHKENDSAYGVLYKRDGGQLIFQKHKWIEINKNKSIPKITHEMQYTEKDVDETFYNSFRAISWEERLALEIIDIQTTEKRGL